MREGYLLQAPVKHWYCPNCTHTDVTYEVRPHTRFHNCAGLKGFSAPMIEEGIECKVEAVVREDYVGNDIVRHDGEGRPIMAVVTTRDDGNDCAVFAPTVRINVE